MPARIVAGAVKRWIAVTIWMVILPSAPGLFRGGRTEAQARDLPEWSVQADYPTAGTIGGAAVSIIWDYRVTGMFGAGRDRYWQVQVMDRAGGCKIEGEFKLWPVSRLISDVVVRRVFRGNTMEHRIGPPGPVPVFCPDPVPFPVCYAYDGDAGKNKAGVARYHREEATAGDQNILQREYTMVVEYSVRSARTGQTATGGDEQVIHLRNRVRPDQEWVFRWNLGEPWWQECQTPGYKAVRIGYFAGRLADSPLGADPVDGEPGKQAHENE